MRMATVGVASERVSNLRFVASSPGVLFLLLQLKENIKEVTNFGRLNFLSI